MIGFGRRAAVTLPIEAAPALPTPVTAESIAARVLRAAAIHVMGPAYRTPELVHEMLALSPLIDEAVEEALLELDTSVRARNALSLVGAVRRDWAAAQNALDVATIPAPPVAARDWSQDTRGALATVSDLIVARLRLVALRFDAAPAAPHWPRVRLLLQAFGYDEQVIGFLRGDEAEPIDSEADAASILASRLANNTPLFRTELIQLFEFLTGVLGLVEPEATADLHFAIEPAPVPQLAHVLDHVGG